MAERLILILGTGYVGLTSAACLASLGHPVTGLDIDRAKIDGLLAGKMPIFEAGLGEVVAEGLASGRFGFTTSPDVVGDHDIVMLCLPTPAGPTGSPDISVLRNALLRYRERLRPGAIVVTKSTVPLGTHDKIRQWLDRPDVHLISNPEFLREGSAVSDFLHADRVVVGGNDLEACQVVADLYAKLDTEVIVCDPLSAELIKYASNAFLATKLSFVNELARICDELGADVGAVTHGLGTDHRISASFLTPGPGWGGSCFPKDVEGLAQLARSSRLRVPVIESAAQSNRDHFDHLLGRIGSFVDGPLSEAVIAIWGLAFKAGTDDTRSSPALELIERLKDARCEIRAHDPVAAIHDPSVTQGGLYEVCVGADLLLVATEWPLYAEADMAKVAGAMRDPVIFDMRAVVDTEAAAAAGITVHALGRASNGAGRFNDGTFPR